MSVETIARRYATALADVVLKTGETETVKNELMTWEGMLTANAELQTVFSNPAIAHASKEKILESLLSKANGSRSTSNFLRVLLRNGRLTDLAEINEKFLAVLEERAGRVSAEVVSARELSDAQKDELRSNLEKLTGKQVQLKYGIDQNIIGGVVTRVGSTIYDGSVRTQLENLRQELIGS